MERVDPRDLVEQWQGPIYNLARHWLGNDADAADATQEVFARALRKLHRFDPSREIRPWLYRLATREIRDQARKARVRRTHEAEGAQEGTPMLDADSATEPLLAKERRELVERELRKLPESSRSILVLRYFQGLSQSEVARVLGLPRTTIQSRLRRGLDELRDRLRVSGYAAAAVAPEALLTSVTPLPVPTALASTLAQMASAVSTAAPAVTTSVMTIGGLAVNKAMIFGGLGVALLSMVLGFGLGRSTKDREQPPVDTISASARDDEKRDAKERDRVSRLEADYAAAMERVRELESEALASRGGASGESSPGADASGSVDERSSSAAGSATGTGIDWSDFRAIFSRSIDVMLAIQEREVETGDVGTLSAKEQAVMMEFMAEAMKLRTQAYGVSDDPFFDERVLAEFFDATLTESLGLSDSQIRDLQSLASELLGSDPNVDLADLTPVESFQLRREIASSFDDRFEALLDEAQLARWNDVETVFEPLMGGQARATSLGLKALDDTNHVLGFFESAYLVDRNDPSISLALDALADSAIVEARDILSRYGRTVPEALPLTRAEQAEMEMDFLSLQVRLEETILPLLAPEQVAALRAQGPHLLRFTATDEIGEIQVLGTIF